MGDLGNWPLERITPSLTRRIVDLFANGRTQKLVCEEVGVPPGILKRWLDIGAEDFLNDGKAQSAAAKLYKQSAAARAHFRGRLLDQLNEAGAGKDSTPGSAGWLLERLERDDFGATSRLEVTGPEGGPLLVDGRHIAVGWADLFALARDTGQEHLFGIAAGSTQGALPAPRDVLPDPAVPVEAADGLPGVQRP